MPPSAGHTITVEGVVYPREVPVPEPLQELLGERWFGRETVYQTGAYINQPYTRWHSRDGRHKSALSPNKMITLDCEDRGVDPGPVLQMYKNGMEAMKAVKAEERRIEAEARGELKGERRLACIEIFLQKYGELKGTVVHQLPGWVTKWDFSPNSGQVHVTYIEPSGQKWLLLKDLMACFGAKIEAEEDISEMMTIGFANQNPELFAEGAQTAKVDGTYTYTQDGTEMALPQRESKKRVSKNEIYQAKSRKVGDTEITVASSEDFVERETLALVQLPLQEGNAEAATAKLKDAGAPDAAGLANSGVDLHAKLQSRGFDSSTEVLAIFDKTGSENASDHPLVSLLSGLYYKMGDDNSGKPTYQKMQKAGEGAPHSSGIVCQGLYISWNDRSKCWKFGSGLDQSKAGYAKCAAECPSPAEASAPWSLLRADFPGLQKAGA